VFVLTTESKAAAAVRIGASLALGKRAELSGLLRPCFARTQVWLQAGKYVAALMSELPERNGWAMARHAGDATPDKTQRLLNHASWDTMAAMSAVRRFAAAGLDQAARRNRWAGGMRIGALDETGQEKQGSATAGVKRQYLGCAGRVANGINTVHLAYVRERTGHALIGARQWIPREQITDPVVSLVTGLPLDLEFRTKGQLAIDICADAYADRITFDFICGDEVYGASTRLREFLETRGQAYVLRVASNFMITLAGGMKLTCAQAVKRLLSDRRRAGLPLLPRPRRPAAGDDKADQGGRAALAGGGELRAGQCVHCPLRVLLLRGSRRVQPGRVLPGYEGRCGVRGGRARRRVRRAGPYAKRSAGRHRGRRRPAAVVASPRGRAR